MTELKSQMDDRVTICLAIESTELAPATLTERLGTRPDREWVIGDLRSKTGKQWECHGWVIETTVQSGDSQGQPASQLIPIATERFESRVRPFADAAARLGSAQKYVVLTILSQHTPGIEFSHSFLQLVATLGGTLQIDL